MKQDIANEQTTPENVFDQPAAQANPQQQKGNKLSNTVLIASVVASLTVGGIGGYIVGNMSASSSTQTASQSTNGIGQDGTGRMGRMGGGLGTVTAVSSDSITIKDQFSSSTTTYEITSNTTVTDNGSSASVSDIAVGDQVMIQTSSSDSSSSSSSTSSTTATEIQLNPSVPSGGMGPNSSSSSSSTN